MTVHLALFYALMARASPEDAAELSRRREPNNILTLLAVIVLSVVSLGGVAAMLNHPIGRPRWVVNLHMAASLLAVILSWLVAHVYFGLPLPAFQLLFKPHALGPGFDQVAAVSNTLEEG